MPAFYEFFSGGGMARAGLGPGWQCLFANDIDPKKARAYNANWSKNGKSVLVERDVAELSIRDLPGRADLAWASFPCQDLSLAGRGAGLAGERSSAFWPFWDLMQKLRKAKRAPRIVAIENVRGLLTSHGGEDFRAILLALQKEKYAVGAFLIDAIDFLPQSRPRLLIVGIDSEIELPNVLIRSEADARWHPESLVRSIADLPPAATKQWRWIAPPVPPARSIELIDLIEKNPADVAWHSDAETLGWMQMMTRPQRQKLIEALAEKRPVAGAVYKRIRLEEDGVKRQRAEIRFDAAGCLRVPAGGSSRQTLAIVDRGKVRSRLFSKREIARLMGLPEDYLLPEKYNEAYHLVGDGVAVPAVAWLRAHLFEPILKQA